MVNRFKTWLRVALCMAYALFLLPTQAEGAAVDIVTATESSSQGSSSWVPDWVQNLISSIDELFSTLKDLMSGKLIYDSVQGFIVSCVDEMLAPLFGAFAKSYLFTPHVAEMEIIYKGWSIFMVIGMVLLLLGIGWLTLLVIRGRKEMGLLLKVFLLSITLLFFSLTILNILNVSVNWMTQNMLAGIVGTTDVSYEGLTGQQILKALVLGAEGITNPVFAAQTVGQVVVATPGGMFTLMIFLLLVVLPLFLVSVFKSLIVMIAVIFIPVWIAYSAYAGSLKSVVGFINLYVRTLLVGLFCALHFAIFVRMQGDYVEDAGLAAQLGIHPTLLAVVSVIVLLIFFYFFYLRVVWRAVKDPVQLGGGDVMERAGAFGVKTAEAMHHVGKRMGAEGLQKRSLSLSEAGKRMQTAGQQMQKDQGTKAVQMLSSLTRGASEAVQGVSYTPPTWLDEVGTVVMKEEIPLASDTLQIDSSMTKMMDTLMNQSGFTEAVHVPLSKPQQTNVQGKLQGLDEKLRAYVTINDKGLYVIGPAKKAEEAKKQLSSLGVSLKDGVRGLGREGVFVDVNTQQVYAVDEYQETHEMLEQVKGKLPTLASLQVDRDTAASLYQHIEEHQADLPWAADVRWSDQKGLQIAGEDIDEAVDYLQQVLAKKKTSVRMHMPQGSTFLPNMVKAWQQEGSYATLLQAMQIQEDHNVVYVPEACRDEFKKAYAAYREDKTPYWRTKSGKVKVILDGVPVDHGAPPLNGLDMGSFEALQKRMLESHHQKSKGKEARHVTS